MKPSLKRVGKEASMTNPEHPVEKIVQSPDSEECCVIVPGRLDGLHPGDTVRWDAAASPMDLRIEFPNAVVFGVTTVALPAGGDVALTVQPGLPPTLQQDYSIRIVDTMKEVKTQGGVEPTIIIGD